MPELCAITESIKIIGTKPRLLIVRHMDGNGLHKGNEIGFNELKKLSQLSSRTLALNLKFLVEKNVIKARKDKNRKFYSLTKRGEELLPIIANIGEWGKKWDIYG